MPRLLAALVALAAFTLPSSTGVGAQAGAARPGAASTDWPTYGHDAGGQRFSPLTQITPANVDQLQVAWVYHMRPAGAATAPAGAATAPAGAATAPAPAASAPGAGRGGEEAGGAAAPAQGRGRGRGRGGSGFAVGQTTPLVVNGVMYLTTPYGRVVALDSATGKELWTSPPPAG
jgi:quinoprotein glucose dehydrogenase